MRVVTYERKSTDMQSEKSIPDQRRQNTDYVERKGWTVVGHYEDVSISAASMVNRPGISKLLEAIESGEFDIIVAEDVDRLSRDLADVANLYKVAIYNDVQMWTILDGHLTEMHIAMRGLISSQFLKALAEKTKRGQKGNIIDGKSAGGKSYGVDIISNLDENGVLVDTQERVNPHQAAVILRIMTEYAEGRSPKSIAARLNREGIPAPRTANWGASTIQGNRKRGTGILNNELYVGVRVWNRLTYRKNPKTGKRISFPNPTKEWMVCDAERLRIVTDDLWDRVKERQARITELRGPAGVEPSCNNMVATKRPQYLLSGLVKCGACGGGMAKLSQTSIGCSTARNKGTCQNRKTVNRVALEAKIVEMLRSDLMSPALLAEFGEQYAKYQNDQNRSASSEADELAAKKIKLKAKSDNLLDLVEQGHPPRSVVDRLSKIDDEMDEIDRQLAEAKQTSSAPLLIPTMGERYGRVLESLLPILSDNDNLQARNIVRELIGKVIVTPVDCPDGSPANHIELQGHLAGILNLASQSKVEAQEARAEGQLIKVVAGVGFEPTTFRL